MTSRLIPVVHRVTRLDLVRYAGASGDFNPIHFDDEVARQFGLDGVIAHGMFTMGLVTRLIEPLLVQGYRVAHWSNRFRSMVAVNHTITIDGSIHDVDENVVQVNIVATVEGQTKPALTGSVTLTRGQ